MKRFHGWILPVLLLGAALGCDSAEETLPEPAGESRSGEFQGATPEEIRMRAEPMSPEMAESLGIVDTTIHMEEQLGGDTIPTPPESIPSGR